MACGSSFSTSCPAARTSSTSTVASVTPRPTLTPPSHLWPWSTCNGRSSGPATRLAILPSGPPSATGAFSFGDRRGLKLEHGVLDQADEIADRAAERAEFDAFPDILDGLDGDRAHCDHVFCGCRDVAHAPVGARTDRRVGVRVEAQLVAARVVPDEERLVEVGLNAQRCCPPRFARGEVGGRIHDGAESEEHSCPFSHDLMMPSQLPAGSGVLYETDIGVSLRAWPRPRCRP